MALTNKQFQDMLREGIEDRKSDRQRDANKRRKEYQKGLDAERAARAAERAKNPKPKPTIPTIPVSELKPGTRQRFPNERFNKGTNKIEVGKELSLIFDEDEAQDWFKRKTDSKIKDEETGEWLDNEKRDDVLYGFYGSDIPIAIAKLAKDPDRGYYFYYRIPNMG